MFLSTLSHIENDDIKKEVDKPPQMMICLLSVLEAGLEPAQPSLAKGF